MSLAEEFHRLFAGLQRAHGHYSPRPAVVGDKTAGTVEAVRSPPTIALWEQHLAGEYSLGVVPIREDNSCRWGALDIDVGFSHEKIVNHIADLKVPLIVCRSKSGGAHLFLFLSEDIPAELVRMRLMEWAVVMGYPNTQIWPKQARLAPSTAEIGNWLNMPYFDVANTGRYAYSRTGPISAEEFIKRANELAQSQQQINAFKFPIMDSVVSELTDGPPCLQSLAVHGFPTGSRAAALYNLGVYLRKRYGDSWKQVLDDFNHLYLSPPLSAPDVIQITKALLKRDYNYRCKEQPICTVCSKQICLTRKYGIGRTTDDPGVMFGDLTKIKTTPETYIWDVDGFRLQLSIEEILDQRLFRRAVAAKVNKVTELVKELVWSELVRGKMAEIVEIEVTPEMTTPGQLFEYFRNFIFQRAQAREIDEMLLGRPFYHDEVAHFRSQDFLEYLRRHRSEKSTTKEIYNWLRDMKAKHHVSKIKGVGLNYWSMKVSHDG